MMDKGLSVLAILVFSVLVSWGAAMATGYLIEAVIGPLEPGSYMLLGMSWAAIVIMPVSVYILRETIYYD